MLSAHTASFLKFIDTVLDDISRGVASGHHLHNVRCGIENILALLEYNNELVEKADQLSRRTRDYITYRGLVTAKISDGMIHEDVDRLRVAREALAGFRFAVEHSQPNSKASLKSLWPLNFGSRSGFGGGFIFLTIVGRLRPPAMQH